MLGLNMLTRLSTEFVVIFFVLSGFSIAHSLRNNQKPLPFYKRRFIRLYPPYVVAIFWAMLVVWIIQTGFPQFIDRTYNTPTLNRIADSAQLLSWPVFFKNLIYMPQLDGILRPFWSLIMEVIFYLAAPFLLRNRKVFYSLSILLFIVSLWAQVLNWQLGFIVYNFMFYNFFFTVGTFLYYNYEKIERKINQVRPIFLTGAIIGLFFLMIAISLLKFYHEPVTALLAAAMSILLIVYLLSRQLQINWLIGIGRFSYTLYITHFPTIFLYLCLYFWIAQSTPPYIFSSLVFIPCIFFCLAVAYAQYWLVEKRSKHLLDKLRTMQGTYKKTNEEEVVKAEKTNW
jgi:peptidoglycan/LPS O-acetylase OafA/YrhL